LTNHLARDLQIEVGNEGQGQRRTASTSKQNVRAYQHEGEDLRRGNLCRGEVKITIFSILGQKEVSTRTEGENSLVFVWGVGEGRGSQLKQN